MADAIPKFVAALLFVAVVVGFGANGSVVVFIPVPALAPVPVALVALAPREGAGVASKAAKGSS